MMLEAWDFRHRETRSGVRRQREPTGRQGGEPSPGVTRGNVSGEARLSTFQVASE